MLDQIDNAELRAKAQRLMELAAEGEALSEQRRLMADLGSSRRLWAARPLVRSWACNIPVGKKRVDPPKRRWFWFGRGASGRPSDSEEKAKAASEEKAKAADQALRALKELWPSVLPNQYTRLDQELRATSYFAPAVARAWQQLSAVAAIDALPDSGELRIVGLSMLSCHPSGRVRETALRELVTVPLVASLPFLLVRANDWVQQIRAVAYERLLALDEEDVETLAPWLERVQQLESQGRREPGPVEHLLNLLRTPRGLAAVQGCWASAEPSLRRSAVRFSFDAARDRDVVLHAAAGSDDPVLRRWAVEMLSGSDDRRRAETFRRLSRDSVPMVATAALDALDGCIAPSDVELLKDLRCAPSPGLQHTARYMLEKHFGETSHRDVYLSLLSNDDERSVMAAASGLAATGESEDHSLLLTRRLSARSKVRQQLLSAAAGLDPGGARRALFEDLGHELRGVSKAARRLLMHRVLERDAGEIAGLLESPRPHVRKGALLLAAGLGHWTALPLILRKTRDPEADVADAANRLLETWLARHFHGIYRPPEPSARQASEARAAVAACGQSLERTITESLERALAGE